MGLNDKINDIVSGDALTNPYTPRLDELATISVTAVFTIDPGVIDQTDIDAIQLDIDAFDSAKASLATAVSDFTTDISDHYTDHWKSYSGDASPATSIKTNFALLKAAFDTKNKVNAVDELPPIDYTNGDYYLGTKTVDDDYNSAFSDSLIALASTASGIAGAAVVDSSQVIAATGVVNGIISDLTALNDEFLPIAAEEIATYHSALEWLTAYGFVNFASQQTDPNVVDKLGKFTTGIV